jgi:pimeloyl-ACP methyl ester carboxylesterase
VTQHAADLRGLGRLIIDGIVGLVDVVEAMHANIASIPALRAGAGAGRTTGITGLVYRTIGGTVLLAGRGLDLLLAQLAPLLRERGTSQGREARLAALNGVMGDYLAASNNSLAITLQLRRDGVALPQERALLAAAVPEATGKLLVLVHGLCMSDMQWNRKGHDHGAALARDVGYTPAYLRYNSGLHVSTNGRAFADRLENLVRRWPVPLTELVIIGHSMGGLVARSACHYGALAGHEWVRRLNKLVFLGTPHHGAPLERGGNWVDVLLRTSRYTAPLARLGRIRSAGITDLRFGSLVDEDWSLRDRFARTRDRRIAVPPPRGVACYAVAGSIAKGERHPGARSIGDGMVPLASALGQHADPRRALAFDASRRRVAYRTGHLDLLSDAEVYAQIRRWLTAPASLPQMPAYH